MQVKIGRVFLNSKYPETFTQAYHAGILVSMVENYLPDEFKFTFLDCIVHFHSLREVFGERLWTKIKTKELFKDRLRAYEMLTYQSYLPRTVIGGFQEFSLGYSRSYKASLSKRKQNVQRTQDLELIAKYLSDYKP